MKGKADAREVKAHAIAELITGDTPTVIAARHNLPPEKFQQLESSANTGALAEASCKTREPSLIPSPDQYCVYKTMRRPGNALNPAAAL